MPRLTDWGIYKSRHFFICRFDASNIDKTFGLYNVLTFQHQVLKGCICRFLFV